MISLDTPGLGYYLNINGEAKAIKIGDNEVVILEGDITGDLKEVRKPWDSGPMFMFHVMNSLKQKGFISLPKDKFIEEQQLWRHLRNLKLTRLEWVNSSMQITPKYDSQSSMVIEVMHIDGSKAMVLLTSNHTKVLINPKVLINQKADWAAGWATISADRFDDIADPAMLAIFNAIRKVIKRINVVDTTHEVPFLSPIKYDRAVLMKLSSLRGTTIQI